MIEDLPGYFEAEKLGYTLFSYGSAREDANYLKDRIMLSVYKLGTAKLSHSCGLIILSTGILCFPNKNFHIFEKALLKIINEVNEK